MSALCDLHMHSSVSDGNLPVRDLVRAVHSAGVQAFALTDHDCVDGFGEAQAEAEALGLRTLPGVEIAGQDTRVGSAAARLLVVECGLDPRRQLEVAAARIVAQRDRREEDRHGRGGGGRR